MPSIKTVADAIADRLRAIDGLQVYVEPPGTVDAPAAVVLLRAIDYDTTMSRGSDELSFIVDLFTTLGREGIENIYGYLDGDGGRSIKAVVEEDPTLNGVVFDAAVTGTGKPDRVDVGGAEFYHVEVMLTVEVSG